MPLYVYGCPHCGADFERLVPMSRPDEVQACPRCGSVETRRAITAAATVGTAATGSSAAATRRPGFT